MGIVVLTQTKGAILMKKAYITILAILMIGLAACSSEEIPITTSETVAVKETLEETQSTTVPTETEMTETTTTQSTVAPTEQTEPPSEPTQTPQKPPKETESPTQETTPPEQTDPPISTEPPVQTEPPAETNPPEKIDLQALINYGREYAASTHGYEVCIGLRDGYYPPDDHQIYTMEDGYKAVRASVDCTTRMLLAYPGTQIVKEIDGVLCRARIDIAIQDFGDGAYRIWVYYG